MPKKGELIMLIKLDFSEDCKANNYRLDRHGTYAIYVRKNCFHKWKQIQCYADINIALRDFKRLKEVARSMSI